MFKVISQILLLAVLFFVTLDWLDQPPAVNDSYLFSKAMRVESFSDIPPLDSEHWVNAELPDSLIQENVDFTSIWYQINFDKSLLESSSKDERWAVYVDSPWANAAIYINGSFLGDGGNVWPPIPVYRRPLLFGFSSSLLRDQGNILHYRYIRGTSEVFVKPVYIAPLDVLLPAYEKTMFMKRELSTWILMMMGVVTSIMLLMFILRPKDKLFGWYVLATVCWIIHYLMRATDKVPLENQNLWSAFSYLTLGLFAFFASQYLGRCTNIRVVLIDKIIIYCATIGGTILLIIANFFGGYVDSYGEYVWMPSAIIVGFYSVFMLIKAFLAKPSVENQLLLVSMGFLLVVAIRDYLYDFTNLELGSTYYLQFAAGFVMIFWAIILMRRFSHALETSEVLNLELEQRVATKAQQLERFYAEATEAEKEKVIVEERKRIMRDMHDGLGGQLVQVLALAEKTPELAPIRQTLSYALRDLRLIIDSLSIEEGDLVSVLATFRFRTEKMIQEVGLSYDWRVKEVPELSYMGPASVLQVLRILQESITNIMKHASASVVTISTWISDNKDLTSDVVIEIFDNGKGFVNSSNNQQITDPEKYGHGLKNMHYRAKQAGGSISIVSSAKGTGIRFSLPIQQ